MPDTGDNAQIAAREQEARKITQLVYILQAASFLVGITFIAAVIINYLKTDMVAGTWLESHFRWQITTFWVGVAFGILGVMTFIVLIGIPILVGDGVWVIYRIIKGWMYLSKGKELYPRRN